MAMEQTEFKFPDEQEPEGKGAEDKLEIEIEDDTPPEDKGRAPMPKELLDELEQDELAEYSEKAQQRLKQMRKVWHDERREKESARREQDEAVKFARKVLEENKRVKTILNQGGAEYGTAIVNAATYELELAKRNYKEAYDAGDTDKIIEAQNSMQTANLRLLQAKSFKMPSLQEDEKGVESHPEQVQTVPKPDDRAMLWQKRNDWFGQDEEMTATALGLHEKLKRNGVHVGSDEYYATLDKTMRKRFPENFEGEPEEKPKDEPVRKTNTVVAPASRSTSSNKIRLKATQLNLAKKLGLTPEQYAREVQKLERQNG